MARGSCPLTRAPIFASFFAVALTGCASGTHEVTSGEARASRKGDGGTLGLLRPDQIERILRDSPKTYRVAMSAPLDGVALPDVLREDHVLQLARRMNPFLEVRYTEGKPELRSHLPDEVLEPLFEEGGQALAGRNYMAALSLFARAVQTKPGYFKSYTYLGKTLFFLERYVEAKSAFEVALDLNPFDYQAYLFLGDTLHQLGDYPRAKAALTKAFMLNRENEVVKEHLSSTLAKLGLRVREERLMPRVRVEPGPKDEVVIRLDRTTGGRWFALAACMACWAYEDACRRRSTPDEDPLRLAMYRECLLNQVASIAVRRAGAGRLSSPETALLDAVEGGFLEAIVFWEVVARRAPAVMLLLPERLRTDIERYIDRYVFEHTGIATRAPVSPSTLTFQQDGHTVFR